MKEHIDWLNCGNCGITGISVETKRGSSELLYDDDETTCNECGQKGVIECTDGIAEIIMDDETN